MHRAVPRYRPALGRLAERAGRFTGSLIRTVPGAGGALLVAFGAGMVYRPLLFIVGGLFLLLLDRRVP